MKRILLITSVIAVVLLILTVTNIKSLANITTAAQQYVNGYITNDSGEIEKDNKPEKVEQTPKEEPPKSAEQPPKAEPQNNPGQPVKETSFEKTTFIDENGRQIITNEASLLVLVNKKRNLSSSYVPQNMVIPEVPFLTKADDPKKYLRKEAAQALEELFEEAKKEKIDLFAASGYRSYERQKAIFEAKAKAIGEKAANRTSAYPGQSEHQTGLAMDVTSSQVNFQLVEKFGELKEGKWLQANAHKFGFIIRYPKGKENITGYSYEPWHIRFVGKETAQDIFAKDITLEEYFIQVYGYR